MGCLEVVVALVAEQVFLEALLQFLRTLAAEGRGTGLGGHRAVLAGLLRMLLLAVLARPVAALARCPMARPA
ncbi:hypothetical protein ACFWAX_34045 [Streptomyces sp. NPDC059956]|uniref:hypothetical protein n=1 Tax=Streptomyces sp. NPDC059956 TaxID=3347015 RepID=UPI00364B3641